MPSCAATVAKNLAASPKAKQNCHDTIDSTASYVLKKRNHHTNLPHDREDHLLFVKRAVGLGVSQVMSEHMWPLCHGVEYYSVIRNTTNPDTLCSVKATGFWG